MSSHERGQERRLRIGSRGSDLALWQARYVASRLPGGADIVVIKTKGDAIQHLSLDKVEGKGFFTKEIETALLADEIDIAVHSYKDLPTELTPGLVIAAVPERATVNDVLVAREDALRPSASFGLKKGTRVGTSSLRRKAQLLASGADVVLVDLRGNVPTRVGKVESGELGAVMLAEAGLERLGIIERAEATGLVVERMPLQLMTPAAAQGALAVQVRENDSRARAAVATLHDAPTGRAVAVERALLARFGGGCHLPLGAHAYVTGPKSVTLFATVTAPDGSERLAAGVDDGDQEAVNQVHTLLVSQGAARYL